MVNNGSARTYGSIARDALTPKFRPGGCFHCPDDVPEADTGPDDMARRAVQKERNCVISVLVQWHRKAEEGVRIASKDEQSAEYMNAEALRLVVLAVCTHASVLFLGNKWASKMPWVEDRG